MARRARQPHTRPSGGGSGWSSHGGTPTARPEDIEVSPHNRREVFISYTDGATGTTFRWERFRHSGESGAELGAGFANLDNMAFDEDGNVWGVTDMSTGLHNGFTTVYSGPTLQPGTTAIDHTATGSTAGNLVGTFGTNWIFYVPVRGRAAGVLHPFGYGPPRCEMTGPTFVGDTLLLSVQHPSEDSPINGDPAAGGVAASTLTRPIEMLDLAGGLYQQVRTLPRGSNWPNNGPTEPPKPSVIGIRRRR